ncbi:transglutaminase-like domain-containing protein [Litoreibacter janthinus]|uniref:Transglutaminase-like superfamily protein n=1 Tax=Litoreibacter janthinus TaxID=670154 RepID=A0A1I6GBA3_9RHOB|nr:transglutaminase family protein [Litoreibacter janthinus]SFR39455.1 Transglutaminase-like superfamily protein [Litoreibacter janthinus]
MLLTVTASLVYSATQACEALLQIEPTTDAGQRCDNPCLSLMSGGTVRELEGEDAIGIRRWVSVGAQLDCYYTAHFEVNRPAIDLARLQETPRHKLPNSVISYLMPSRYCQSDLFLAFTAGQFGGLTGGPCVLAMNDWVASNFIYDINSSDPGTTATDSFAALRGVCRDYAHVLISLVRAVGIPARFVSAYAPDVKPQDFHAVVEVFLEGEWHLIDPTGMAHPTDIVRICVGRDAADASFLTSYGPLNLQEQSVQVQRVTA